MVYRILASSYTDYIYLLSFDPVTGSLTVESTTKVGRHPSWITSYPGDNSLIYAGLEQENGRIVVLKYDGDGKGTVVEDITSGGRDPCSLLASKDELFVANYSGGGIALLPVSPNPPYFLTSSPETIELTGSGPNKARQQTSHPHQVVLLEDEEYQELLVPDLGADRVCRFKKAPDGTWKLEGHVQYEPGSGPRHVAYHGTYHIPYLEMHCLLSH
ncbi:hypothetical protein AX17_006126 [Amanita inopinata Kibby_2008]|nr:hypothetical protein AX17_006126 [Amanita inopinata Kibby_2008]